MSDSRSIFEQVAGAARLSGFDRAGIAAVPEPGSPEDYAELRNFATWIENGSAGEMEYLKRRDGAGRLLRSSLRVALPWARSVIVCAANYNAEAPRSIDSAPEGSAWIARYAWSGAKDANGGLRPADYHKVLLKRLKAMQALLHPSLGRFEAKCFVDTGPVVERVYAKYAGLGWIGKNTCILNQELGSWLLLGVIVTSLELPQTESADAQRASANPGHSVWPIVAADRCGSCTRCIDACPTGALTAPYQMDASLCISYLTIEKRGEIPEGLRGRMGRQVFGCDICQDVCPWNAKARTPQLSAGVDLQTRPSLINPALDWLAGLDEAAFARLFFGSPVKRARLAGLRRNVAIAMGNSGLRRFLPRLIAWAGSEDHVLAESAAWARRRIAEGPSEAEAAPAASVSIDSA